jgi:hypothetical protein
MKENVLRSGRLYLFIFLTACFSFVSCNSDDEDEIEIIEKTFLEKYDGTKWMIVGEYEGYILYLRVNNSQRVPFELWGRAVDSPEDACYGHQDGYMDEDEGANSMEIIENSDNRFTITNANVEFWCLEIRGETLKFGGWSVYGDADPNIWDDPDSMVFKKTTVNVDAFEICPEAE